MQDRIRAECPEQPEESGAAAERTDLLVSVAHPGDQSATEVTIGREGELT